MRWPHAIPRVIAPGRLTPAAVDLKGWLTQSALCGYFATTLGLKDANVNLPRMAGERIKYCSPLVSMAVD